MTPNAQSAVPPVPIIQQYCIISYATINLQHYSKLLYLFLAQQRSTEWVGVDCYCIDDSGLEMRSVKRFNYLTIMYPLSSKLLFISSVTGSWLLVQVYSVLAAIAYLHGNQPLPWMTSYLVIDYNYSKWLTRLKCWNQPSCGLREETWYYSEYRYNQQKYIYMLSCDIFYCFCVETWF